MSGLKDVEIPCKGQKVAGVIVFVDYRFNVVELSIEPDIIRKTIKKVKKRPKEGHTVKAVCVLKRSEMNFATFMINSPNHFQGHLVHCPMNFEFELFDLYGLTITHSTQKLLVGNFNEKRQKKRARNNSIGDNKATPPKKQRLESEQSVEGM